VFGSGSFLLYDGETDVALVKDVVIVTINYRLGPLGFMGGDALRAESPDGSVGNYGFQDQRQALRFTRSIIASFGGNPGLVTLFGESAGGGSTTCHLISPRSAGLFERAIIESGSAAPWTAQPYNISAMRFTEIAANAGCGGAADVLACMRGLNYSQLISADNGNVLQGVVEWSPVIDGVEIPDDPRALIAAGAVNPVPVMLGWNHDEGTLFNREKVTLNASDYVSAIASYLGPGLGQEVAAAYPLEQQTTPWWALTNILTDSCMLCPGIAMSRGLTAASVRNGAPVFTYYYTHVLWVIEYVVDLFKPLGCFHGA
jgi:para-nitrobenzyl esterase